MREVAFADLVASVVRHADSAASRTAAIWVEDPHGAVAVSREAGSLGCFAGPGARVGAPGLQGWMEEIGDEIRSIGAERKGRAQVASIGLNVLGTSAILAVFVHTGGLTGAELGIGAATAVLNQKLLEAIFGEGNVAAFVNRARARLDQILDSVFETEKQRFLRALGPLAEPRRSRRRTRRACPCRRPTGRRDDTRCERLQEAAAAAADLGLADHARSARELVERIERRLGFPGEVYVLALAGGTGVGKSSVLNALAGTPVSPARALRPTTEHPLAWVANEGREELRPLLDWLGVERVVGHDRPDLSGVAILDLPDVDSVRIEHRATVDALLPRIDAVAWVVDPEKYDDERLHEYLRRLAPHAARMRFIFNKADRLNPLSNNRCWPTTFAADWRKMGSRGLGRRWFRPQMGAASTNSGPNSAGPPTARRSSPPNSPPTPRPKSTTLPGPPG